MPYVVLRIHPLTQRVMSLYMSDATRRSCEYLAAIHRGERSQCVVGRGKWARTIMSVDVLEWGEQQTPPWRLERVDTSSDGKVEWSYLYLRQEMVESSTRKRQRVRKGCSEGVDDASASGGVEEETAVETG